MNSQEGRLHCLKGTNNPRHRQENKYYTICYSLCLNHADGYHTEVMPVPVVAAVSLLCCLSGISTSNCPTRSNAWPSGPLPYFRGNQTTVKKWCENTCGFRAHPGRWYLVKTWDSRVTCYLKGTQEQPLASTLRSSGVSSYSHWMKN